jgi:pyridoxamine 5'-phosphate oxidase
MNWFAAALAVNKDEANACVLSTISALNIPSSRVVLLKGVNENGFTFFTNYTSSKAKNIEHNNNVALNFYWPELERQVRINGVAKKISAKESELEGSCTSAMIPPYDRTPNRCRQHQF